MKSKEYLHISDRKDIEKAIEFLTMMTMPRVKIIYETLKIAESEIEEKDKYITDCKGDIEMLIAENQSKDKEIAELKEHEALAEKLYKCANHINDTQLSEIQSLKEEVERLKGNPNKIGRFIEVKTKADTDQETFERGESKDNFNQFG